MIVIPKTASIKIILTDGHSRLQQVHLFQRIEQVNGAVWLDFNLALRNLLLTLMERRFREVSKLSVEQREEIGVRLDIMEIVVRCNRLTCVLRCNALQFDVGFDITEFVVRCNSLQLDVGFDIMEFVVWSERLKIFVWFDNREVVFQCNNLKGVVRFYNLEFVVQLQTSLRFLQRSKLSKGIRTALQLGRLKSINHIMY